MMSLLFLVLIILTGWLLTWVLLHRRTVQLEDQKYQLNMIRKAARAANGGIYIYKVKNNETFWDTNTIRMFGLAGSGRIIDQGTWEQMVHPEDRPAATQMMTRVLSSSILFYDQSYRILRPDGEVRWIEGSGYVTRDEKKQPVEITGLHFDITAQVMQNIDLRQSKYRAERAMEAKTQFLANMSHEIRTPMNAIIGMIELLNSEVGTPLQRRYLHTLQNSSEVLLRIINDVLDVSKIEAGKLQLEQQTFNLRHILLQCFSVHTQISERKHILLTGYVHPQVPREIKADSTRLQQVIINLLSNAFKFTLDGNIQLRVNYDIDEQCLRFEVEDTGIGIASESIERLFDRFTQADASTTRKFGGTGLGLTIVKQIVELWGGRVMVLSEPNQGTNFIFTLPIVEPPVDVNPQPGNYLLAGHSRLIFDLWDSAPSAPKAIWVDSFNDLQQTLNTKEVDHLIIEEQFSNKPADELVHWCQQNHPKTSKTLIGFEHAMASAKRCDAITCLTKPFFINQIWDKKFAEPTAKAPIVSAQRWPDYSQLNILCVDDNPSNLIVLSGLLKRFGVRCRQALSGREAINIINQNHFDMILMDYEMPEMDGPETTRQILAIKPMLIVGLSAHTADIFKQNAEESGMKNFLRKPIRVDDLANLLNAYFPDIDSQA